MRWLLWILVGVALLVGVLAAVGASLPVAHVAERSRRFARPLARVRAAIGDPTAGHDELELIESGDARVVTRVKPGKPYGGTWTYELAPDGDGTRVTLTERGEVYNPIFRLLSRYVFGQAGGIEQALVALGKELGEG